MNDPQDPSRRKEDLTALPSFPAAACCGPGPDETPESPIRLVRLFTAGSVPTPVGAVPRVSATLEPRDRWGTIKARWGVGRMDYAIDPGLYALGTPDKESPVLVTAN
jgi:hypothetical protein